jgi:hypothetical protein
MCRGAGIGRRWMVRYPGGVEEWLNWIDRETRLISQIIRRSSVGRDWNPWKVWVSWLSCSPLGAIVLSTCVILGLSWLGLQTHFT